MGSIVKSQDCEAVTYSGCFKFEKIKSSDATTPLLLACIGVESRQNNDDVTRLALIENVLRARPSDVNMTGCEGQAPIHVCAMMFAKPEVVDIFSEQTHAHFDINQRDCNGNTALHVYCTAHMAQSIDFAARLLHHGVDVNARNNAGRTALHYAACDGNYQLTELLLNAGADVDAQDTKGWTALNLACSRAWPQFKDKCRFERARDTHSIDRYYKTVTFLLTCRADGNLATHHDGVIPLLNSIRRKHAQIADLLLLYTLHKNWSVCDSEGRSVLHLVYGQWEDFPDWIDKKLLRAGANPNLVDGDGRTALEVAIERVFPCKSGDDNRRNNQCLTKAMRFSNDLLTSFLHHLEAGISLHHLKPPLLAKLIRLAAYSNNTPVLSAIHDLGFSYALQADGSVKVDHCVVSLQQLALQTVRGALHPRMWKRSQHLPLPKLLQQKLTFF